VSRVWISFLSMPFYMEICAAKRDFKTVCCLSALSLSRASRSNDSRPKGDRNLGIIRPVYTKHFEMFRPAYVESATVLPYMRAQQVNDPALPGGAFKGGGKVFTCNTKRIN